MDKTIWEYRVIKWYTFHPPEDSDFNSLGAERWELVSISGFGQQLVLGVFKRPLANAKAN